MPLTASQLNPAQRRVNDPASIRPAKPAPDRLDPQSVLPDEALAEFRQGSQHQAIVPTVAGLA